MLRAAISCAPKQETVDSVAPHLGALRIYLYAAVRAVTPHRKRTRSGKDKAAQLKAVSGFWIARGRTSMGWLIGRGRRKASC